MHITEIWRYPVKSMQGERLSEAEIGTDGLAGDRGWALFDTGTGAHLTARRKPELLLASARVIDGELTITLPDGSPGADEAALSQWLGRSVELRKAADGEAGTFETQAPPADGNEEPAAEWFRWQGPEGSFHDSTRSKVSLVSASAFRSWDRRRFRINLVVDGDGDVGLVGRSIELGTATATVTKQIDRCVMTTRPQPDHEAGPAFGPDLDVLRTINRESDSFLGVGALIDRPGVVRVGDPVRPT